MSALVVPDIGAMPCGGRDLGTIRGARNVCHGVPKLAPAWHLLRLQFVTDTVVLLAMECCNCPEGRRPASLGTLSKRPCSPLVSHTASAARADSQQLDCTMIESAPPSESSLLVTLEEIGQVLSTSGRPTESLQNIVALIRDRFGTEVCSVYLLEPDRKHLVLAATVGLQRRRHWARAYAVRRRAGGPDCRTRCGRRPLPTRRVILASSSFPRPGKSCITRCLACRWWTAARCKACSSCRRPSRASLRAARSACWSPPRLN